MKKIDIRTRWRKDTDERRAVIAAEYEELRRLHPDAKRYRLISIIAVRHEMSSAGVVWHLSKAGLYTPKKKKMGNLYDAGLTNARRREIAADFKAQRQANPAATTYQIAARIATKQNMSGEGVVKVLTHMGLHTVTPRHSKTIE